MIYWGIRGKNGLKQDMFRFLGKKQRSPAACPGHVVYKKRKEESHPCRCQGLVLSRDYFSCLRKRTRSFPKLTLWRNREFLRIHGPVSRGFESWSKGVTWIEATNSLLGMGRSILRDKEVQKPPERVLVCLHSHRNWQSSEWDCLSTLSQQEQKVKKFT